MRRGAVVIALTGASGFVGKALLRALLDAGYHVRALEHRSPLPTHPSLTTIHGSLDDAAIAGALVRDVDVVLHVGGLVLARRDADFFRVNTEATRTLATAARDAGVARFLFVSSLAAREPQLSAYAKSKYAAELLLPGIEGLAWDIIRPPAIYGPGDANSLPLMRMLARGQVWLPVKRQATLSMLHVDDLVSAIMSWLRMDASPRQQTYEIADHETGYRWQELLAIASTALHRPIRLYSIPRCIALSGAACMHILARVFRQPCFVTPGKIREMTHADWSVNSTAFKDATGWSPHITFSQGIALTMQWYQKHGNLGRKT
jgi:2-alkyl-3-oxoalkanoate reductase